MLLLSATLVMLSGGVASGQDVSAAKALFEKGIDDLQAGKLDTACPAIAESYRLDPRPGTLFALAECFGKAGKTASAVARYEDYLSTFGRMTPAEQAKQHGRDASAREQHDRLKPHVPLLTLRLADGSPPGTTVSRDGVELGRAVFGIALPVDPGQHTVVTQAPGGPATSEIVMLAADDKKDVTLKVKGAEPGAATGPGMVSPAPPPGGGGAGAASPPVVPDQPEPRGNGQRTAGFVVGGVGAVGLVVGAITGGLTLAKKSTISSNCNLVTKVCQNSTGQDAVSAAQTTGLVSTVAFIGGGVLLAGGVVVIVTAPKAGATPKVGAAPARLAATWSAGPGGGSLGLRGGF